MENEYDSLILETGMLVVDNKFLPSDVEIERLPYLFKRAVEMLQQKSFSKENSYRAYTLCRLKNIEYLQMYLETN